MAEPQSEAHVPTPETRGPLLALALGRAAQSCGYTARPAPPCAPGRAGWQLCQTAWDEKHPGAWVLRPTASGHLSHRECWSLSVSHLASSQGRQAAGRGASSHAATGTGGAARRPARPSFRGACTGRCFTATFAEMDSLASERLHVC